jgi:uncharacterized protein YbjT (DUF2867 family)
VVNILSSTEKKMIVVTAPTGNIGGQVLDNVLASGAAVRVIARDPARLPTAVRNRAEVVEGSHADINVVNKAFAGADAVFWLVPPDPRAASVDAAYVDFSRPACQAFRRQGVKRVVGISALGRGTALQARAGLVTSSLKMDDLIAGSGVSYRAVTSPSFMDNMLRQAELIKTQGMFVTPVDGDRKLPTCATRDIAAAASRLLLDTSWSGNGYVAVLGPKDLSFNEMAQILTDVLGEPVRYQQIPAEALKERLIQAGMSEAMAQGTADMMAAKNEGLDNAEPRTPGSSSPTTFRQWAEQILKPAVLRAVAVS